MAASNSAVAPVAFGNMVVGFAKLQGEHFEYFMQTYSVILGRNTEKSKVDLDIFALGGSKDVSRRHARIYYDFEHQHFALEVLGKHECSIEGASYLPGSDPVKLNSQDLIEISGIKFYFLLPTGSIAATVASQRVRTLLPQSSSSMCPENTRHSGGHHYDQRNGGSRIEIGTETQEELTKQSNSSVVNSGQTGAHGQNEIRSPDNSKDNHGAQIRACEDPDSQQALLKEEDVVGSLATLISDLCGPGEWLPMGTFYSKLLERFGKTWSSGMVERYLLQEGGSSRRNRRPWRKLLLLLKKYSEHFTISKVTRGKVTSEYVGLVSLLS